MRIDNIDERHFYEIESVKNDWSLSELKRQCNSALYERLALSKDKAELSIIYSSFSWSLARALRSLDGRNDLHLTKNIL